MAAMTTAITEFSDNGNSRTYTYTGHTVSDPRLVIQKRKVPALHQLMVEDVITTISGVVDGNGDPIDENATITTIIRRPKTAASAGITALLATHRDIFGSDEATNTVNTQNWLK